MKNGALFLIASALLAYFVQTDRWVALIEWELLTLAIIACILSLLAFLFSLRHIRNSDDRRFMDKLVFVASVCLLLYCGFVLGVAVYTRWKGIPGND